MGDDFDNQIVVKTNAVELVRAETEPGRWCGDMIAMGIVDPVKVVRTALQDAASVAGLLVTTEAMIAELPKKDAPAMPGGMGGMGMDGMM